MGCSGDTMQRMVANLKAVNIIKDVRVEQAMLKTDRSRYCPTRDPYKDAPYSIGYGATISAPHMHAYALEVLKDRLFEGAKVLDVGSGSGYLTACMGHMVGPMGRVYGVEHIMELVKQSVDNIRSDCSELLDSGAVEIHHADGRVGLEKYSPFDAIHVGACADGLPEKTTNKTEMSHANKFDTISPLKLIEQLKEGGRMVLPVQRGGKQFFETIDKLPGGEIQRQQLFGVSYVPLTDIKSQLER